MTTLHQFVRSLSSRLGAALASACLVLAACGGSADAPPPAGGVNLGIAPSITQQPASATVTAGQAASFSVVADGTGPLAYQWQRGGSAIAGATAATYAIATTAAADSGAVFKVVVSNAAGSATSQAATLTVMADVPVLSVTQQPAASTVVAGAVATFTVAATCSAGTLDVQWQRSNAGGAFANITGARAATYSVSTVAGDSGAQFHALLDCSGQAATTSAAATLTVTAPSAVTSSALPIVVTDDEADLSQFPIGIVQEASGSFLFCAGNTIKRLSADLGKITLVAGNPVQGSTDGPASSARFYGPIALVQDSAGNTYVAENGNRTIRRIAPDGTVSTLAGTAAASGNTDGTGSAASFLSPNGIALGSDGDLYVSDALGQRIRRVTTAGVVTTYAGSTQGYLDGTASTAQFNTPGGVAVAANGDVLVADNFNSRIRRIVRAGNGAGLVETLAGSGSQVPTASADGIGTSADIVSPSDVSVQGNTLNVLDGTGLFRQIDLTTRAVTTLTGSRTLGVGDADGTTTSARLGGYGRLTSATSGGFLMTDTENGALRSVSAAGVVHTIATNAASGITPGGTSVLAQMPLALFNPQQGSQQVYLTPDPAGNLVITEQAAHDVRRIDASGAVSFIAGLTANVTASVDGKGSEAQFRFIGPVSSASHGVLYVGDVQCVRRVGTDGTVTTLAGLCNSSTTATPVDGNATTARFTYVNALAVGPNGDVFVADGAAAAVRRIDAAGNVTTVMGVLGQPGTADGDIATARLTRPDWVAFAPDGALIVADGYALRRIAPDFSGITTLMVPQNSFAHPTFFAIDTDASIYFGGIGLYKLAPGATTPTLLIPYSQNGVMLGSAPAASLYVILDLTLAAPKQLVVVSAGQLITVSLP